MEGGVVGVSCLMTRKTMKILKLWQEAFRKDMEGAQIIMMKKLQM